MLLYKVTKNWVEIILDFFNASENISVQGGLYWGYKEEGSDIIENIIARRTRLEKQFLFENEQ